MKVYAVVEKLIQVKPFVMLKNVVQNIILLIINQNQPNILLITKNTPFFGVFCLLLQNMVEHVETQKFFIAKLKPSFNRHKDSNLLTIFRNGVSYLPLFFRQTETYSKLTMKILRECLNDFLLLSVLQTLSKNLSIGTAYYYYH